MTEIDGLAWLDIDLGAIAANWAALAARHPSGPTGAAVKADAYGLGAVAVAGRLYAEGCRHFFVAVPDEAFAIREVAPDALLCVLNGLPPGVETDLAAADILPAIGSLEQVARWAAAAGLWGGPCRPCCMSTPAWPAPACQPPSLRRCETIQACWRGSTGAS